jgi:hypothetical protein
MSADETTLPQYPILWDVLGFPGSSFQEQTPLYFDREDVKKAIHAPTNVTWDECSDIDVFPKGDASSPSSLTVLPNVIEKSKRTVIVNGLGDFCILAGGTRIAIQKYVLLLPFHGPFIHSTDSSPPLFVLGTSQHDMGGRAGLPDGHPGLELPRRWDLPPRGEHAHRARADVLRGRAQRTHGAPVLAVERLPKHAVSGRAAGYAVKNEFMRIHAVY